MLFLVYQRSYVNGRVIEATPTSPKVERFDAKVDLDHVSSQWYPMDDEAKDALVRLQAQSVHRRANPDNGAGARGAALRTALVAIQKQQHAAEERRALEDAQGEIAKAIANGIGTAVADAEIDAPAPAADVPGAPKLPEAPRPPKPLTAKERAAAAPAARPSDTSPIGG